MSVSPPAPAAPTAAASVTNTAIAERLGQVVEILDMAHRQASDRPASLVRLRGLTADSVELALRPVASHEVYDELVGSTLPDSWEAAGFVVHGSARSLGDPVFDRLAARGRAPSGHASVGQPTVGDASVVVVAARDGTVATLVHLDGSDPVIQVGGLEAATEGRLVDVVRRSLGLSTSEPADPVASAMARIWLHRVHVSAIDGGPVDRGLVDALAPPTPRSWRALREQCVAGVWPELVIAPELAAWMDDGMFSRWCLAAFPEPLEVLVELSELIGFGVWSYLVGGLVALRTDDRSSGDNLAPRVR